jgi:hypothetical protein
MGAVQIRQQRSVKGRKEVSMKTILALTMTLGIMITAVALPARAHAGEMDAAVHAAIDAALEKKKMQSGTLDLYDGREDRVRNLRLIEKGETVNERDGQYYVDIKFRDITEGDIVTVEAEVTDEDDDLSVDRFFIKEVKKLNDSAAADEKEFTDADVQTFMKDHINKQTQFNDGKLMMFDKDAEKMRNLELLVLKEEVRRIGIFMSSSAQFKDVDSGEIVDIDISVEQKKGKLNLQAMRIRNVSKGK